MRIKRRLIEARASLLHYLQQGFTPSRLAAAVALGIFIAFIPMVGVHSGLAFLLAWILRVNPVIVFIGTQISNPLTFPFQLVISIQTGHLLLHGNLLPLAWSRDIDWLGSLSGLPCWAACCWLSFLLGWFTCWPTVFSAGRQTGDADRRRSVQRAKQIHRRYLNRNTAPTAWPHLPCHLPDC